ncbi:MAG: hypothetical protein M3151_05150 [Actinomycetota bacterium]|nr:hypothetical protein [Actinomycetota bacterium]
MPVPISAAHNNVLPHLRGVAQMRYESVGLTTPTSPDRSTIPYLSSLLVSRTTPSRRCTPAYLRRISPGLKDRAGSQGLDTWHESGHEPRGEVAPDVPLVPGGSDESPGSAPGMAAGG